MMGRKHILAPGTLYNIEWYRRNNLIFENNPFGEDQLFIYNELLCMNKAVYIKKPLYKRKDVEFCNRTEKASTIISSRC